MRVLKLVLLVASVSAGPGCSTIAHVEGTGDVGVALRTIESLQCRAGQVACNYGNGRAPAINRTIGGAKQLKDYPRTLEGLPYILQQVQTL